MKRVISLPFLIFYGLGTILGAGIYVLIGEVVADAGINAPLSFLLAGILAVLTGFSYAELSSRYPQSAGAAVYVHKAFHRDRLSQLIGVLVMVTGMITAAALANGFAGYLREFVMIPDTVTITLLILSLCTLAVYGISESVVVAAFTTLIEFGGLLLVIWVGGSHLTEMPSLFVQGVSDFHISDFSGIFLGAFLAFFAFIGFEDMVNVAEEVKRPRLTIPIAILTSIAVSILLYFLVVLVAITSIPVSELAGSEAPLARILEFNGNISPQVISLIGLVAILNGALVQLIMSSRILYGMADQGLAPRVFASVNWWTKTPLMATLFVGIVSLLLALWFPLRNLANATSFIVLFVFTLVNAALFSLKRRHPEIQGAVYFPIWIPFIGMLLNAAFLGMKLISLLWSLNLVFGDLGRLFILACGKKLVFLKITYF
ncbi:MAG: amino acid permease [Candidatus Gracilibacteria bacterium]|nr:amino acid permease [Candidatus Gracilibacteria bacterium]